MRTTYVFIFSNTITVVNTLQERLVFARKLRGFSQAELARRAKCRQSTIGNIESGFRKTLRDLVGVARALDVSPDWLADGRGHAPEPSSTLKQDKAGKARYATHQELQGCKGAAHTVNQAAGGAQDFDEWTKEALSILASLSMDQKRSAVAALKTFVGLLNPPQDGQTLSMAA